jgi:hypothetical protein
MKQIVPYLIIASIIILIVIILFIPVSETDSFPGKFNEQITTVIKKSDTLNTAIIHLNIENDQLKAKDITQQKEYIQRIRAINTLPVDSQINIFKKATGCTRKISLKTSTPNDTLAEIPINSILNANMKFIELESKSIQNLLLDSITANQNSIISTLQQVIINQKIQIDLLTLDYKQQKDLIRQKDKELKKQNTKHRLEFVCASAIIALIILF